MYNRSIMLLDLNKNHPSIDIKNKTLLAVLCAHNETSPTLHMNQFLQCNTFICKKIQHRKEITGNQAAVGSTTDHVEELF